MASATRENRIIASVRCPNCRAAVGQHCRTPAGRPLLPRGEAVPLDRATMRPIVHPERRAAWVAIRDVQAIAAISAEPTLPEAVGSIAEAAPMVQDGAKSTFACKRCGDPCPSENWAREHCKPSRVAKRTGYRKDKKAHAQARNKVPAKRRKAIAELGGAALAANKAAAKKKAARKKP